MRRKSQGFSLIELSVTLALMGVLGLVAWRLLPASRETAQVLPAALQLAQAQAAVEGFVLRTHRLPCPDTDADGRENCAPAALAPKGGLAWRDLGLSASHAVLRYGVLQNAVSKLSIAQAQQTPLLPPGFSANGVNGLDLCVAIHLASINAGLVGTLTAGVGATAVPIAYALAHPGQDGNFQGLNLTGFELPGRPVVNGYDDTVLAVGLTELSGRLTCPAQLGKANATARAAYAAYDMDRAALQVVDFRALALESSQFQIALASVNLGVATLNVGTSAAAIITSVSVILNSVGVLSVTEILGATLQAAAAVLIEVLAAANLANAVLQEVIAQNKLTGAQGFQVQTSVERFKAGATAVSADNKGLNP
jgi:prepilin-type N-terminal cleavage/methylation domain-containing protein